MEDDHLLPEGGILSRKAALGEEQAKQVHKRRNAAIAPDEKQFCHQIKTDEVFGTRSPRLEVTG